MCRGCSPDENLKEYPREKIAKVKKERRFKKDDEKQK